MASVFGHIAASSALGYAFFPRQARPATLLLAGFCAFAPDFDVAAFHFGVPYSSIWGHRGWTHSACFTLLFGAMIGWLAFRKNADVWKIGLWCALSTLSHPVLDMLTNGGLGCAFWWPLSTDRHFFPFRPVLVSPLGAGAFFSRWGWEVLKSEIVWIGLPGLALVAVSLLFRRTRAALLKHPY